jgi:antitoxin CptB
MDPEVELGKLRWRCRRGMKELDLLLIRYLEQHYRGAPCPQQEAFRALLEAPDPAIYAYCLGGEHPPDPVLSSVVARITRVAPEQEPAPPMRITQTGSQGR